MLKSLLLNLLTVLLWASLALPAAAAPPPEPVAVRFSEAYELSNIILALTPYGQSDAFEVYKNSRYYREVRAYFAPVMQHLVVQQANYSRKEWAKYLAFRTDAYAFGFNAQQQLVREFAFHAQGNTQPFDSLLEQVNDFARVSGFREFYRRHQPYYDSLAVAYRQSQRLPEVLAFLTAELGPAQPAAQASQYAVVLSPLVYRMNCHRDVQHVPTDFATVPEYLLSGDLRQQPTPADVLTGIHALFTETDHGFVNPVTSAYGAQVRASFNVKQWDTGSGYDKGEYDTFNEYMTWAVYDLFAYRYFAAQAPLVCQNWALQNESRGFLASRLFNSQLRALYAKRKKGQTVRDLYPALLAWCRRAQPTLARPAIAGCPLQGATLTTGLRAHYVITFTQPLRELASFDVLLKTDQPASRARRVVLTRAVNNLTWSEQGRRVSFDLALENNCRNTLSLNQAWFTEVPLSTPQGVDLAVYESTIKTEVRVP
ncbi:MAG: DUF4932 domain-containing protein [Hymenobacter sp.]|nr:MAG: DUF4932 domain-containing protein [Hymenobacter sp.]